MNASRSTQQNQRRLPRRGLWLALLTASAALAAGCAQSKGDDDVDPSLRGKVSGPSGSAVAGATVYLVPASAVSTEEITGAGVLAGTTETFDEPLEDAVANLDDSFPEATTNGSGSYLFNSVPDGDYFVYVEPGAGDTEHIRGGSLCRVSTPAKSLRGKTKDIVMSSSPPDTATYTGMTTCLACHPQYETEKTVAHRLGFRVTGQNSPLQDTSAHPEIDDALDYFLDGDDHEDGTPVYHYDYDGTQNRFDMFKTSLTDPGTDAELNAILWLWRDDITQEYKITIENVANPSDDNHIVTRVAQLTYGGAVYKQRFMIDWEELETRVMRNGLYPLLQFQHEGDDSRYDRTRKVFRDYHLDFYWDDNDTPNTPGDDVIADPSVTKNISRNCMGCHATNYTQYDDTVTGEVLCDSVEDPNGEYDIDHDGSLNDLNTGCESCHGAGSAHVNNGEGRYIVSPEYLSPSRDVQLCGRCHNRQAGADPIGGDHPLNADSEFPPPGISRAEFLADYVKPTVKGPLASKYWADFTHAKSHHQQTPDFVKSAHYRNDDRLMGCSDCHDMHGGTGHERALIADPHAPDSPLCMICHADDIGSTAEHTAALLGVPHGAANTACIDCHQNKTSKTGSGHYGFLLSPPTGTSADDTETYFENDVSSHVFDVPGKDNVGVSGVLPANAMPIPYTQRCGVCHDPSQLQYQSPD